MTMVLSIYFLFAPLLAQAETPVVQVENPVDRIVIVIEEYTITQSDIALEKELALLLPSRSMTLQYYRLNDPKEALVIRNILRIFAGDINIYAANPIEIQERYTDFRSQWTQIQEYDEFIVRHGLDENRILGLIKSQIIAENYLEKNIGISPQQKIRLSEEKFSEWLSQSKRTLLIREVPPQTNR